MNKKDQWLKLFIDDYRKNTESLIKAQNDKIKYLSSFINAYAEAFFYSTDENLKKKVGDFMLDARRLIPELSVQSKLWRN